MLEHIALGCPASRQGTERELLPRLLKLGRLGERTGQTKLKLPRRLECLELLRTLLGGDIRRDPGGLLLRELGLKELLKADLALLHGKLSGLDKLLES